MVAKNAGHQLYGVWKKHYRERNGRDYIGSKYRDAAMLKGVAEDIGVEELRSLIIWYFENKSIHDFTKFIFNYDKLLIERNRKDADVEYREQLRQRTRELLERENVEVE